MSLVRVYKHEDRVDAATSVKGREFLCYFVHRLLDFRLPEAEAAAELAGCRVDELAWRKPAGDEDISPFWYLTLPSEEAARGLISRSLLVRGLFEVWGEGSNWDELQASIAACPAHIKDPWTQQGTSFRIVFESFGFKLTWQQQSEALEKLKCIPFQGHVDLTNPDVKFWLLICAGQSCPNLPEEVPYRMYFGREVAVGDRSLLTTYALTKRQYLGPTSMDHEMAFIMCLQAQVRSGSFVLDPYAGTGSILVAAAHYGAHVVGCDIDIKVIRDGKVAADGTPLTIYSNFEQYGLQNLLTGLIRMDTHVHPFRQNLEEVFHAVVGDPPYGVRAGGRKSSHKDHKIRDRATHIPSTDAYSLGECLRDLLDLSARLLVVGGRLVYFLPATPETYCEEEIPAHPALKLLYNIEQPLTKRYSRRLITMVKVKKYDAAEAAAYHASKPDPSMAIDRISEIVYESFRGEDGRRVAMPEDRPVYDKKFRSKMV